MSYALRIVDRINSGESPDERIIPFVAALLRPIYVPAAERFNRPVMRRE